MMYSAACDSFKMRLSVDGPLQPAADQKLAKTFDMMAIRFPGAVQVQTYVVPHRSPRKNPRIVDLGCEEAFKPQRGDMMKNCEKEKDPFEKQMSANVSLQNSAQGESRDEKKAEDVHDVRPLLTENDEQENDADVIENKAQGASLREYLSPIDLKWRNSVNAAVGADGSEESMDKDKNPSGFLENALWRRDVVENEHNDTDAPLHTHPLVVSLERKQQSKTAKERDFGIEREELKNNPEFSKYFNMLKVGIPIGAVKNALKRDGKDPSVIDDPKKALSIQMEKANECDVAIKNDPEFSKYFNMLKMGIPVGAVKNALQRDGKDPCIIDLDPEKPIAVQREKDLHQKPNQPATVKTVRRKQLYWTTIDESKIHKRSLWSLSRGKFDMQSLKYDSKEFEKLFTEIPSQKDRRKRGRDGRQDVMSQKKGVKFIDSKRGLNGGIVLAHLKIPYSQLAKMVDVMESGNLDALQLRSLKEILPSYDERKALTQYVNANQCSEASLSEALDDLSECEKFMISILKVSKPGDKLDSMLFRDNVYHQLDDLMVSMEMVGKACNQVLTSTKLRNVMAMILSVVNQINTGGKGKVAAGFSLGDLLKLHQSKAFDKKTSILQYVVKIIKENDEALLSFANDIEAVEPASCIILDALESDLKTIREELHKVQTFAKEEADRQEEENEEKPSISELRKQGLDILLNVGLGTYTSGEEHGRTPLEKFIYRAAAAIQGADTAYYELKRKYSKVLEYFGEDESMPSNEFFETLNKFCSEFNSVVD